MKKILLVAVATASVLASVGIAFAAGSVNLTSQTVTGTVQGLCKEASAPQNFGLTIDPSLSTTVTGTDTTGGTIKCTKNLPYTVSCTSGYSGYLKDGSGNQIPYTINCPAGGTGQGFNNTITLNTGASVVQSDAADVPAGTYTDTVTVQVSW